MNKVWIYTIGRQLSAAELRELEELGGKFVSGWTAHDRQLSAGFDVYAGRIIVVKVNEQQHNASGCSIDKLLRFIREMEHRFSAEMLNRMLVPVKNADQLNIFSATEVRDLLKEGKLGPDTTVLNTAVSTEEELRRWEQPLKNTWLRKYL